MLDLSTLVYKENGRINTDCSTVCPWMLIYSCILYLAPFAFISLSRIKKGIFFLEKNLTEVLRPFYQSVPNQFLDMLVLRKVRAERPKLDEV